MDQGSLHQHIQIFEDMKNDDDQVLVAALTKKGLSESYAERLVAFLPLAFGRVVVGQLAEITLADQYSTRERGVEKSLNDEPVYMEAVTLARSVARDGTMETALFRSIAYRSAELAAVNQALTEGTNINGHTMLPPVFNGYNTLG